MGEWDVLTWSWQVCDVARASTALSALTWVAWTATFVAGVVGLVKGRFGRKVAVSKEVDMHQGV